MDSVFLGRGGGGRWGFSMERRHLCMGGVLVLFISISSGAIFFFKKKPLAYLSYYIPSFPLPFFVSYIEFFFFQRLKTLARSRSLLVEFLPAPRIPPAFPFFFFF